MNDKKRVLKQFEWFEVQTKVRQIIAEVFEPLEKKIIAQALSLGKLQSHSQSEQQKVEYLTLMVNNDPHIFEHGIFATIQAKISEAKIHTKQLQAKVHHLQEFIDKKVELLELRLCQSGQVLEGLRQFKQHVQNEISSQNKKLVESQQNLFSNFDQINADISKALLEIQHLGKQQATTAQKMAQLENATKQYDIRVDKVLLSVSQQVTQTILKQERHTETIESIQEEIRRVGRFEKYVRQLQSKIQNLSIAVDNVEYKTEVIQPIVSLTQINEYAHHILPPAYTNNISIYYHNRYRQMVDEIINGEMERGEKREKIKSYRKINLQLVKEVHQRSIKCVFKLKKQKLAEQGIDIDSLPHDKKQELLANMHIDQEFSEVATNKSAPQQVDNREKQTLQEYTLLRQQLTNQLRARIQQQLKDSKQYVLNMEEEWKKQIGQVELKLNNLSKIVSNNEVNMELESKALQQHNKNISKQMEKTQKDMQRVFDCLRDMSTVVGVHQLIQKQDERDRLSIALIGVRERHRDELKQSQQSRKRNSIQLSEQCLSCTGNPNYYNEFFKMACLNYTSSPIKLNNQNYERIELLEKMQSQLIKIKDNLDSVTKTEETKQIQTKKEQFRQPEEKMHRYESQIMALPIYESRSSSQHYTVRNVSSSQEMRLSRMEKSADSPRILNSSEMIENLMDKNANRLVSHKRDALREYKRRKESVSRDARQRSDYMINVGNYFKELRKQNEQFIK